MRLMPHYRGPMRSTVLSAALLLAAMFDVAHADNVVGAWESPAANNWPLIAVHAALTPDGRVLTYGTWSVINGQNNPAQQTGYFKYDIWDPATGLNGRTPHARQCAGDRHLLQLAGHPSAERQHLHRGR